MSDAAAAEVCKEIKPIFITCNKIYTVWFTYIFLCSRPHRCCTLVFAKRIVRMSSAQICDILCCFLQAYKIGAEVVVESTPAKCKAELTKDGGDYDAATMVRESLYFNIYIYITLQPLCQLFSILAFLVSNKPFQLFVACIHII